RGPKRSAGRSLDLLLRRRAKKRFDRTPVRRRSRARSSLARARESPSANAQGAATNPRGNLAATHANSAPALEVAPAAARAARTTAPTSSVPDSRDPKRDPTVPL